MTTKRNTQRTPALVLRVHVPFSVQIFVFVNLAIYYADLPKQKYFIKHITILNVNTAANANTCGKLLQQV